MSTNRHIRQGRERGSQQIGGCPAMGSGKELGESALRSGGACHRACSRSEAQLQSDCPGIIRPRPGRQKPPAVRQISGPEWRGKEAAPAPLAAPRREKYTPEGSNL